MAPTRTPEALMAALCHGDDAAREQAAWALGLSEDAGARDALVQALADPCPRVREQAVWALAVRRDRQARLEVAACLADEAGNVRARAAWALGLMADAGQVGPLIDRLCDVDPLVREQAAWALGQIGALGPLSDNRAADRLLAAAADPDARVRDAARLAIAGLDLDAHHVAVTAEIGDLVSEALRVVHSHSTTVD